MISLKVILMLICMAANQIRVHQRLTLNVGSGGRDGLQAADSRPELRKNEDSRLLILNNGTVLAIFIYGTNSGPTRQELWRSLLKMVIRVSKGEPA